MCRYVSVPLVRGEYFLVTIHTPRQRHGVLLCREEDLYVGGSPVQLDWIPFYFKRRGDSRASVVVEGPSDGEDVWGLFLHTFWDGDSSPLHKRIDLGSAPKHTVTTVRD